MKNQLPMVMGLWQPTALRASEWARDIRKLRPLRTTHRPDRANLGCMQGQAVWGRQVGDQALALCWDWAELRPGVVALANPMGVCSNVRLTTDGGETLPHGQALIELNTAIHELNWQRQVCDELSRYRARSGRPVAANEAQSSRQRRVVGGLAQVSMMAA